MADRIEEGVDGAHSTSATYHVRRRPDPDLIGPIDVVANRQPERLRGFEHRVVGPVVIAVDADVKRPSGPAHLVGAELMVLEGTEGGKHFAPPPPCRALVDP